MIRVTPSIAIDESEIEESFIRSPGPGGQNVNKVASAVQLRFDVRASKSLPQPVRLRLERLAASRLTREGVLILVARVHRSQERNRREALDRLVGLIRRAATAPRIRRKTKPTFASRRRRLEAKGHRAKIKKLRRDEAGD
jgi:ribosome-associated protein